MDETSSETPGTSWMTHPVYAAAFRCIGVECEDHCCGGWDIPLDPETYRNYKQFQSHGLAPVVAEFVQINPPPQPVQHYARIEQTASGLCPFFGVDHLCGIQKEYGPQLLSSSCSIYPRSLSRVGQRLEGSLSLSCPEAARNVLLQPNFMESDGDLLSGTFRTDNVYSLADGGEACFLAVRRAMIELVRDRNRPLWERLLLVGQLSKELDALGTKDDHEALINVVKEFRTRIHDRQSTTGLDSVQSNPGLLMDVVFELTEVLMRDGTTPRFQEVFLDFVQGISSAPASPPGSDTDRFLHAERTHYRVYFEAHPYVLENLLTNYMLQNLFPFGRIGSESFTQQTVFDEYLQMATQFVWMNALLVGQAGRYREEFADEHVVRTLQAFARGVEHYPSVLIWVREAMQRRGLHSLEGMAILLKREMRL